MPKKIAIPGREVEYEENIQFGNFMNVSVVGDIHVDRSRSDSTKVIKKDIEEDDIIEVRLENGETWWGTLEQLQEIMPQNKQRSQDDGSTEIQVAFSVGSANRGIGDWVLKGLRILRPELEAAPARLLIANREKMLVGGGGLFKAKRPDQLDRIDRPDKLVVDEKPYLLLIHGTGSCTEGSFSGFVLEGSDVSTDLSHQTVWKQLQALYPDRILAFEHPTLSKNPVENVIDLVKMLPKGISLDVLTYSRGGLLGDLLARTNSRGEGEAFNEQDYAVFRVSSEDEDQVEGEEAAENPRAKDIAQLKELNELLGGKQLKINKVIRVASPSAGTTLASRRLDLYLNVMLNLIGKIPFLVNNPVYEFLSSFLMIVVKKRLDPMVLPGLEAMVPDAPLIRMLNNPTVKSDTALLAIAGNAKGNRFWNTLVVYLSKLYYLENNDLVVNTSSMYRGVQRINKGFYFFHQGKEVNHFKYFSNKLTQEVILKACSTDFVATQDFKPIVWEEKAASVLTSRAVGVRSGADKPIVFVLPGIMGSELRPKDSDSGIWLNMIRLAMGGIQTLRYMPGDHIEAYGLVSMAYSDMVNFLSRSHEVIPFPYDWRKPLEDAADLLDKAIQAKLEETKNSAVPIRLLAHSMGGLVAHTFIVNHSKTWKKMQERPNCRFLMLGTPCRGSFVIPRVIFGKDRFVRYLSLLDLTHSRKDILDIVVNYPGLLQLLPLGGKKQDADKDLFNRDYWETLRTLGGRKRAWVSPTQDVLDQAKALIQKLASEPLKNEVGENKILYVAGSAKATPVDFKKHPKKDKLEFFATSRGDGRVTWETGIPDDLREAHTWYMDATHGKLANTESKFNAIYELLERGSTEELPKVPPTRVRGEADDRFVFEDEPEQIPTLEHLRAHAMGYTVDEGEEETTSTVGVYVTNGDLSKAKFPVAIGHFKGESILGPEWVLNFYLKDKLWNRHQLGIYPGEVGTSQVILEPGNRPPGAVVIGLGAYDHLSPGSLVKSITKASLELAMTYREKSIHQAPGLTTLIIGSGYGNLPLRIAIRSILIGVSKANAEIRSLKIKGLQEIANLEFIELYERRALNVLRILRELLSDESGFEGYAFVENKLRREGGERHRTYLMDDQEWWSRIKVEEAETYYKNEDGDIIEEVNLRFTSMTDRARAEENTLASQQQILDDFLEQAVVHNGWNDRLAKTLFELLLPNDFKVYAADNRNILWILDEVTASYPWELLQDSYSSEKVPIAVRAGMVRQLVTANYRAEVKASLQQTALVIGDPDNNGAYIPLPAAQEEARLVGDLLSKNGYDLEPPLIQPTFKESLEALFQKPYRILHLAGHGIYEKLSNKSVRAGMVLGEKTLLTPALIAQKTSMPDLVFVNCCFLGRIEPGDEPINGSQHKLAANLGTQLIRQGARAVVVAGWAVNDDAAKIFAITFYESMLRGMNFGASVHRARKATYYNYPDFNTWGAYQCYGDPFFTLKGSSRRNRREISRQSDRMEVIIALENLISKSKVYTRNQKTLSTQLDLIVNEMADHLRENDSEIMEAVATAYGELLILDKAVEYFDRLRTMEKSHYQVRSLEVVENLRSRLAIQLYFKGDQEEKAKQLLEDAIAGTQHLLNLEVTSERLSLWGSALKRKALTVTGTQRKSVLMEAAHKYKEAHDLHRNNTARHSDYPMINWLRTQVLAELAGSKEAKDANDLLTKEVLEQDYYHNSKLVDTDKLAQSNNFWDLNAFADKQLYELLLRYRYEKLQPGQIRQRSKSIIDTYQRAWQVSGSFKERDSVLGEIRFLKAILEAITKDKEQSLARTKKAATKKDLGQLLDNLRGLREALKYIFEQLTQFQEKKQ